MREIRIYVEGGGDGKDQKGWMREGFSQFFHKGLSRRVRVIPCGSRNDTFRNFRIALDTHPGTFIVLLVDAEGSVQHSCWQHLYHRDNWQLQGVADEQCHLMTQMMEAWFVADMAMLRRFYGQGFNANPIPNNPNVEDIPKQGLEAALKVATRNTKKGEYHKMRHGPKILAQLEVARVRAAAAHCDRLFTTLIRKIEEDE